MKNISIIFGLFSIILFESNAGGTMQNEYEHDFSKMLEMSFDFVIKSYPSYLEIKDKKLYGEDEIKWWEAGRKKWYLKNDPAGIYVTRVFEDRGCSIITSLPFDPKGAIPFSVAPMPKVLLGWRIALVENEWKVGETHYEYWFVSIVGQSKKERGVVFLLTEHSGAYDKRKLVWCGTNYRKTFVIKGKEFFVDESNLAKFQSLNISHYSRSFIGSFLEKQMVVFNPADNLPPKGNAADLKRMMDSGEFPWGKGTNTLEKIPWSIRRYNDLFDNERNAEILNKTVDQYSN